MNDPELLRLCLDASLRGALIALLLQLAGVIWRDRPGSALAQVGLALALGLTVQAISSAPLFEARAPWAWQVPAIGISTANSLLFWLLARVLFDDDFRLHPGHGLGWAAVVALATLNCTVASAPDAPALLRAVAAASRWLPALFALLAAWAALTHWRDDLVEGRRHFRLLIVAVGCLYTVAMVLARLAAPTGRLPGLVALADIAALCAQVALLSWRLQRSDGAELYPAAPPPLPTLPPWLTQPPLEPPLQPPPLQSSPPAAPQGSLPTSATPAQAPAVAGAAPRLADAGATAAGAHISPSSAAQTAARTPAGNVADAADAADPAEARLAEALQHLMAVQHLYREEDLGMARLAQRLGTPEYRLRRVIHHHLGHRNFSAYINGWRLAEAQAVLADPARRERPVLSIALDAGFQSIGPFNRAFKAATGLTPTEFRRRALGETWPIVENGQPKSAG